MRGQAPRCGEKTPPLHVGRGPVPRQAPGDRTFARDRPSRYGIGTAFAPRAIAASRGTGPRATGCLHRFFRSTVGRGPVPRHAWGDRMFARETRSPARVACEGPRAPKSERLRTTVGRGPVPRHAWGHRTFARDRPSRYGIGTVFAPGAEGPSPTSHFQLTAATVSTTATPPQSPAFVNLP